MEYQYYEFRAVDQPLTDSDMRALRSISTRAEITPVSFTNHYEWGSFKGDPLKMMFRYFDAFLYLANWGTRELMFRLPAESIDAKALEPYLTGDSLDLHVKGEHAVVGFLVGADGADGGSEDWYEDSGEGWIEGLLPVRELLIENDLRPLYLGWLAAVTERLVEDDAPEPPVPAGLNELTAPLLRLGEFLGVDADLLEVAAKKSAPAPGASATDRKDLNERIASLPESERNILLLDLASGEVAKARRRLLKRLREEAPRADAPERATDSGRTAGQLIAAAEARAEERNERDAAKREKQRAKREAEAAAKREQYLEELSGKQEETWTRIETLIGTKLPKSYDEAVSLLADLRDVSMRDKMLRSFETRVRALCDRHAKKSTLLDRLRKAKMLTWGGAA